MVVFLRLRGSWKINVTGDMSRTCGLASCHLIQEQFGEDRALIAQKGSWENMRPLNNSVHPLGLQTRPLLLTHTPGRSSSFSGFSNVTQAGCISSLEIDLRQFRTHHPTAHPPQLPLSQSLCSFAGQFFPFFFGHLLNSCPSPLSKCNKSFNKFLKNVSFWNIQICTKGKRIVYWIPQCHHPDSTVIKSFATVTPCLPHFSQLKNFKANPRPQSYLPLVLLYAALSTVDIFMCSHAIFPLMKLFNIISHSLYLKAPSCYKEVYLQLIWFNNHPIKGLSLHLLITYLPSVFIFFFPATDFFFFLEEPSQSSKCPFIFPQLHVLFKDWAL